MSWFNVGFEEAERMSQPRMRRQNRSFWTKPDEVAVVRFLSPAKDTFNIKRAFIREAKGPKYFTSPGVEPDPFVAAGYALQSTFVWKVLDRRILEFTDRNNEEQKIGPRVLYYAVGQRDRKSLQAFESQMLADYNEQLVEDGKAPVAIEDYNITSFDIKISKPKGSAWQYLAVRGGAPKPLSKSDVTLIEEGDFSLEEELAPVADEDIKAVLNSVRSTPSTEEPTQYSYDAEEASEEPTFFNQR